jgi:RND family efflux transporter MFP subunit
MPTVAFIGTVALLPGLARIAPSGEAPRVSIDELQVESDASADLDWQEIETDAPWVAALGGHDPTPETELAEFDESSLDCMVEPWDQIEIRSPVMGKIGAIHVERSDFVERGQLLVELESGLERAEVEIARKRASMQSVLRSKEARSRLGLRRGERAERLYASSALSKDVHEEILTEAEIAKLEQAEARDQRALARLKLGQAQAALERRRARSPIDGVVTSRLMSPGEVVDDETVLELAQLDPLRVEVLLPAARFGSVSPGMKAAVVPEVPGDQVHVATVGIVDRVIDAASGSFGVQLELPNPEHRIPGGLRCRVRFLDASESE